MNGQAEHAGARTPDPSVHQLMNEVTECLQYTRILIRLLAELGEEADEVNCKDVALALRAVEALTQKGLDRMALAHAGVVWEGAPDTARRF